MEEADGRPRLALDGAYYWQGRWDGSLVLKTRWGHRPVLEIPAGAHPHKKAIALLDLAVERLTPEQRALFDRLANDAAPGLDPHAFVAILPMIQGGFTYEQLAKYVGAHVDET